MVFGEVSVHRFVGGQSKAYARGDQPMRFARLILADDGERDLAGLEVLQSFAPRDQFAGRWKNRGDAHNVACGDAGVTQGKLKARQALAVLSNPFSKENVLRDERHESCRRAVPPVVSAYVDRKKQRSEINKRAQRCQLLSRAQKITIV